MTSDSQRAGTVDALQEEIVADLQMRLTYQEDEIRHLNRALERQRTELEDLMREVAHIKQLVAARIPPQVGDQVDETPPHY